MVQELTNLMVERLQAYEKKNGQLPERIIVFRDGVSEVSTPHRMYSPQKLIELSGSIPPRT